MHHHLVSVEELLAHGCRIGSCIKNNDTTHYYPLYNKSATSLCEPILCQTPWVRLLVKPRYIVRRNKRIHFINVSFVQSTQHDQNDKWLFFLNQFQEVLQTVLHRNNTRPDVYTWMNMLEKSQSYAFSTSSSGDESYVAKSSRVWKITTVLSKSLQCFDIHQQSIPTDGFLTDNVHRHIRLIVRFSHVWVNEVSHTAGVAVDILQMQQHETFPIQHFGLTNTTKPSRTVGTQTDILPVVSTHPAPHPSNTTTGTTDNTRCDHPVYGTYFRMLKKRVPKPAVQHKMRMNGLDPDILDWDASKPLPSAQSDTPVDQLSLSLQDDHQLRKTETNTHIKKPQDGAGHGLSLDEIVNGLKSLRKTFLGGGSKRTDNTNTEDTTEPDIDSRLAQQKQTANAKQKKKEGSSSSFMRLLGATFG